jgi:hypothetical protein
MKNASKGMVYTRCGAYACSLSDGKGCKDSAVIIPNRVWGKGRVIGIDEYAFSNHSQVKSVVIPEGVEEIGAYALENCTNLESIQLPQSLRSIGRGAFMHCQKLENITLPPHVLSIAPKTFAHCCSLEHIDLRHTRYIGESAFAGCKFLGDIAIGDALKEIHATSFCGSKYYAHHLEQKDGIVYLKNWVIGCPEPTGEYIIKRDTIGIADGVFTKETHIKRTINPQYDDEMKQYAIALEIPQVPYYGIPQEYFEEVIPATIYYEGTIAEWKNIKLPTGNRIPAHVVAEDGTLDTYL